MFNKKLLSTLIATTTFTLVSAPSWAAKKEAMEEVIITGISGAEIPLSSIPGAAQVIDKQALNEQMKISSDIADMMANLLPGYSPSNQLASNFGQSFRGKKAIVLIDGVLQTTPIRNASREFMTIAPEAIERIEVINGSSALYGNGYAGGVVNFVTRKATSELRGWSSAELNFQPKDTNDTVGWSVNQGVSGPITGNWDFVANFNYRDTGKFVYAEGDLLPEDQNGQGGYANGSQYDILLKLGYGESDNRVDVTYHRYHMDNGLTYDRKIDPLTGFTVVDTTSPYTGDDPSNEVESLAVSWSKDNVLGQTFKLNASIGDNTYEYATTAVESKKYKLVPLFSYGTKDNPFRVTYGIDFEKDTTTQYLKNGSGCWICDIEKNQISPFAQAWYQATEKLEFQLGMRHEQYSYDIPNYTVLRGPLKGQTILGDTLKYKETIFNGGMVFHASDAIDIFAGYSEGYAVDDLRRLRGATQNQVSALKQDIPATKSHNIEVGLRGQHQSIAYSLS